MFSLGDESLREAEFGKSGPFSYFDCDNYYLAEDITGDFKRTLGNKFA